MASRYEVWLTDDGGRRILLLKEWQTLSYSRSLLGLSTMTLITPYREFVKQVSPYFQPDRRIEVFRAPAEEMPLRREGVFLLREPRVYTRESDGVQMLQFYGRNGIDLLRRRTIIQAAGTQWTRKTGAIDDLMKAIVREQMEFGNALDADGVTDTTRMYPEGEFSVQADLTLGPSVTVTCADRNVLDVLKELKDASFQLAKESTSNSKIYFAVEPFNPQSIIQYIEDESGQPIYDEEGYAILAEGSVFTTAKLGFQFQTFADIYGIDRTTGTVFSTENGNLKAPYYSKSHLEEVNVVYVKGFGRGDSRALDVVSDDDRLNASRWNRCETFRDASTEPDQDKLADIGRQDLWEGEPKEKITAQFLNTPGGPDAPRSLYGVDWDLGDLLPVEYAGLRFDVEVAIVYVAVDETGKEEVSGRNEVESVAN